MKRRRGFSSACRAAGAHEVRRAASAEERDAIWEARRELSYALRALKPKKINHDVVVPRGRVPALFELIRDLQRRHQLLFPALDMPVTATSTST